MDGIRLADELITDLLRSAWIVEAALRRRDTRVDESLVGDHASWMTHCVPDPHEPFADLFLARLGGWVDAHAVPYVDEGAEAIADLNLAGPDVVVQLGDLTQGGEEEEFRAATRLLAELDAPVEATIGNHDA